MRRLHAPNRSRGTIALIAVALLGLNSEVEAQRGYSPSANQIDVNLQRHWEAWEPGEELGTIRIDADGVSPSRLRRNTNAVLDIETFLRIRPPEYLADKEPGQIVKLDAIEAGSNRAGVVDVLDGLMTTWWEPDPPRSDDLDLASQWWFVVDLGRIVLIDRIVLRFAPEGQGDPFLLFDVLVSDGQPPSAALRSGAVEFQPVLQMLQPNKTQREFEIDLSNLERGDNKSLGRFVQVVIRGSDLDRGQLLGVDEAGASAFAELDRDDQGLIEHTKELPDGRLAAVSEAVWLELEESRQGPVRYYRRERPRLAELEVWGPGEELIHGIVEREGSVTWQREIAVDRLFDGDLSTVVFLPVLSPVMEEVEDDVLFFDLGSWYWINGYRMVQNFRAGGGHVGSFSRYNLEFSDGARQADGSFKWTAMATVDHTSNLSVDSSLEDLIRNVPSSGILLETHEFDLVKARFFRFVWEVLSGETSSQSSERLNPIAEVQMFGTGFHPEVVVQSPPIELSGSRNLTRIEWEADTPPGTDVLLRTKTGNVLIPDTLYFRDDGFYLGRGKEGADVFYSRLNRSFTKNEDKRAIFEEGPEWSSWSVPYRDRGGSVIMSPSPRRILKVEAILLTDTPDTCATLESIKVHFGRPVATQLVGEVDPTRVENVGTERDYILHIGVKRPDLGFDELVIRPPSGMVLGEDESVADKVRLYAGRASQFASVDDDISALQMSDVDVVTFGDSLLVRFPLIRSGVEVVRFDFPGTLYSSGGELDASLRKADEVFWQRVDVGDATELSTTNSLLVIAQTTGGKDLLQSVTSPALFTPNGDDANDEALFEFAVVLAGGSSAAQIEIFDLGGRLVRRLEERRDVSAGRYTIAWDGADDHGQLVPPGVYAVRLGLDASTDGTGGKRSHVARTIAVAY